MADQNTSTKSLTPTLVKRLLEQGVAPEQLIKAAGRVTGMTTYVPPTKDALRLSYATDNELRRRALASTTPFITSAIQSTFKLSQGMTLVCGVSGQGKSTASANILAGYLASNPDKKALVVTNEETAEAVYNRVACIRLNKNFFALHQGRLSDKDEAEIAEEVERLFSKLIVDAGNTTYDMSMIEDVKSALEHAASGEYGLAILDYLQTVSESREDPSMEPVQVSKELGFYLKRYGRRVPIPVVVFVQLRPNSDASELKLRIENDRTIHNHAFTVIEVVPNFETKTTIFKIEKSRFMPECQGEELEFVFNNGRYDPIGSKGI